MADTHSSAQPQVCEGAAPTSCINNTDIVVLVRAQVSECMAQRCRFGELRYSIGVNGTAFVDLIQFNLGVSRFIVLVAAAVQRSANRQLARGGIKVDESSTRNAHMMGKKCFFKGMTSFIRLYPVNE